MSSLQTVALGLLIVFVDVGSGGWDWVADPVGWLLVVMGLTPLKELLPGYPGTAIGGWVCLLVSVIVFPPGSVDTLDPSLGWLFSLPTLGFCFLLCDGLVDVTADSLALAFRALRVAVVVVAVLPFFVYLVGWEWMTIPSTGVTWLTEAALVMAVWAAAGDDEEEESGFSAERIRNRRPATPGKRAATPALAPTPAPDPAPVARPWARTAAGATSDSGDEQRTWWGGRKKQDQGFSADAVRERLRREREEREAREAKADRDE